MRTVYHVALNCHVLRTREQSVTHIWDDCVVADHSGVCVLAEMHHLCLSRDDSRHCLIKGDDMPEAFRIEFDSSDSSNPKHPIGCIVNELQGVALPDGVIVITIVRAAQCYDTFVFRIHCYEIFALRSKVYTIIPWRLDFSVFYEHPTPDIHQVQGI